MTQQDEHPWAHSGLTPRHFDRERVGLPSDHGAELAANTVRILDAKGARKYAFSATSPENINLESALIRSGVHFFTLHNAEGTIVQKILVK